MRLRDHVDSGLIFVNVKPADKSSLLRLLVDRTSERLSGIDGTELLQCLEERERKGSTGIGQGVAVPHATVEGLDKPICVLAQIPGGVEFDSIDHAPVRFVFMLLSPANAVWSHLRLLARISRIVSCEKFIRDVVAAPDSETVLELVAQEDERHVD
jgi:PTS system nitrogen regulatory IIA component